jgi:D-amino-acid dehydrogenase
MRVMVLGSGVIGVTSAYFLAEAGHEVIVIDRQDGPALETSFANAGEVSPGYSSPWAAPGLPLKALKWLFMRHRPLFIWPLPDPAMWRWGISLLANCTAERYALNKSRMVPLAEYSRDLLRGLREKLGLDYDAEAKGTLQLMRLPKQLDGIAGDVEVLKAYGVPFEALDRAGCIAAEPALRHVADKIAGGLRLPGDETGDCFKFTGAMQRICADRGVSFRYGAAVTRLETEGDRVSGVRVVEKGARNELRADIYVAALASYTPPLLKGIGLKVPIYPVKGYSMTAAVADPGRAPVSTVMDETHKVAITRLGNRIRVGGMAELAGYDRSLRQSRLATLQYVVSDLFPGGGDYAAPQFWSGLRPMTPDGPPVIGPTRYRNLFLNAGHGTLGWTMACGSGAVIADLVGGRAPEIDASSLGLERAPATR